MHSVLPTSPGSILAGAASFSDYGINLVSVRERSLRNGHHGFTVYNACHLAVDRTRPWQLVSEILCLLGKFATEQEGLEAARALRLDRDLNRLPYNLGNWDKYHLLDRRLPQPEYVVRCGGTELNYPISYGACWEFLRQIADGASLDYLVRFEDYEITRPIVAEGQP